MKVGIRNVENGPPLLVHPVCASGTRPGGSLRWMVKYFLWESGKTLE